MRLVEALYRSPLGWVMSAVAALFARLQRPFMVYGITDPSSRVFRKFTRLSSTTAIICREKLSIGDHVWVGHHSVLDASQGLVIGEGVQICFSVGLFSHGSEHAIRLLGREYVHIPHEERWGYTRGRVEIGAYTYIGTGTVVLPGVTIGKGCIVGACSLVTESVPDFSFVAGCPATVRGSTLEMDRKKLTEHDFSITYFDSAALRGSGFK